MTIREKAFHMLLGASLVWTISTVTLVGIYIIEQW